MINHHTPHNSNNKDKHLKVQLNKVYNGFYKQPQSMLMISEKLSIERANICWYCKKLRKNNSLGIAKRGICAITKKMVNFYTTNPELFQTTNQLKLF